MKRTISKADARSLKRRYLIWLYKTTKEELDKKERKFTQLGIDRLLLKNMRKLDKKKKAAKPIDDYLNYLLNKEQEGNQVKFEGKELKPEYYFLVIKLQAIERTIKKVLGGCGLRRIKSLYEKEMTERILKEPFQEKV